MRPSPSMFLRIKPIPASSLPAGTIGSGAIRLPPTQVPSAKAKGKARAQAEKGLSPIDRLQQVDRSSTLVGEGKGAEYSAQAGRGTGEALVGEGLPPNLRLEKHVSPKNRYWGVTRPERRILQRNVFREG